MLTPWSDLLDDDVFPMTGRMANGLEVYETEKEVVVKANVAGVPEDKVDVTFEKGTLYINAAAEQEEKDEKRTHYSRSNWQYSYTVSVPGEVNSDAEPQVMLKDGVLNITFQKAAQVLPKKLKVNSV
jgi:HSP20 family protein